MLPDLPPELVRALESDDSGSLDEIIRARRQEHFDALQRLATSAAASPEHRTKALYALGRWGDPRAVPDIERVLPSLEENGRIAAIDALGRLGSEDAIETIGKYRKDSSPHVRKFVVRALARIGGARSQAELRTIAADDPEEWIRTLARTETDRK
jgi:HEAT repeat protein